ncbi:MAG: LPS export ABC transporter periplasmic protein LptC [Parvularculaceae bacterium]|nr:LPS export ABC transporter periplasmic protein LptC [Parvularculaceae bacterium]
MNATAPTADTPSGRKNRGALDNLTIRRRTTGEAATARAHLMRRLRIALPLVALLLVVAFLLNTRTSGVDDAFLEDFADIEATTQNLKSLRPQFSGVDADGNPYEITADSASQKPENREIVDLFQPRAITSGGQKRSVVEAQAGVFNTQDKRLILKDGVTFDHVIGGDNFVLKTPTATVSIDDQTLVSDKGVEGDGPGGSKLRAERMSANNRNGIVVFEGDVSMRLYPKQPAGASADSVAAPDETSNATGEAND